MLKIRLKRTGRRNNPSFRIIVTESTRGPKSGKAIDVIGFYNAKEGERRVDADKASKWLSQGAQASGTVHNMLVDEGVISGKKINVLPKKSPIVKEETESKSEEGPQASEEKPAAAEESAVESAEEEGSETKEDVSDVADTKAEEVPSEEPAEAQDESGSSDKAEQEA